MDLWLKIKGGVKARASSRATETRSLLWWPDLAWNRSREEAREDVDREDVSATPAPDIEALGIVTRLLLLFRLVRRLDELLFDDERCLLPELEMLKLPLLVLLLLLLLFKSGDLGGVCLPPPLELVLNAFLKLYLLRIWFELAV